MIKVMVLSVSNDIARVRYNKQYYRVAKSALVYQEYAYWCNASDLIAEM